LVSAAVRRPVIPRVGDKYWLLAIGILAAGIGLFVGAAVTEGVPSALLSGLASTFVALGLVTVVSDRFLRNAYTVDLLELVDLSHELYNSGVLIVEEESRFDWGRFLGDSKSVDAIVLDPEHWKTAVWPHVLRLARRGQRDVRVSFPAVGESIPIEHLARLVDQSSSAYVERTDEVAKSLERDWKSRSMGPRLADVSTLTLGAIPAAPPYSVIRVDSQVCLLISPLHPESGGQERRCLVFREMDGVRGTFEWCESGSRALLGTAETPLYASKAEHDGSAVGQ
jgi:hypothetical protein